MDNKKIAAKMADLALRIADNKRVAVGGINNEELVREIRLMVAEEYKAVNTYTRLAESTNNKLAIEVLTSIANEELVHAGEFLRLLKEIDPNEHDFYDDGADEVEEMISDGFKG